MISPEIWLKSFGFERNPFETTEAGSEATYAMDFLHETFVKPQGFDEILGNPSQPKSNIVFASRGKGKTSARLMTAHFCREGLFPQISRRKTNSSAKILPVHHTRFESFLGISDNQSALAEAHALEILLRAVSSLVDMFRRYPEIVDKIDGLDSLQRLEFQYFLVAYKNYISFQDYRFARDLLGGEIVNLNKERPMVGYPLPDNNHLDLGLTIQEIETHLAAYSQISPIDLLARFAELIVELGLNAMYVLVDGVDEIPETSDNFVIASALLIPLLSNLNLMTNTPYLAFKFFVPASMETLLLDATHKVRRDRLSIQRIALQGNDLVEILHRRLAYCSNGVVSSLDAVSSVEIRGQLGKEMAVHAQGNPRHLVLLGRYMLEHRCQVVNPNDEQETYLLNKDDLEWAVHALNEEIVSTSVPDTFQATISTQQETALHRSVTTSSSPDWFRHEFPAPIALAYLVYQRESDANIRLWKMYELVEASLAFLSQVTLALLYKDFKDNTSQQLKKSGLRLKRTSMGAWRAVLDKLPGFMTGSKISSFFAPACQSLLNQHGSFIKAINDERNRSAHGGPQSEQVCETLIEQYRYPLQQYLVGLSFLRESQLVKVLRVKKQNDKYFHSCRSYVGDAFIFPTEDIKLSEPLDSECLWFLCGDGPINLHPLMIVTSKENMGENIWLYQGFDKESVTYKNYGMGRTTNIQKFHEQIMNVLAN